MSESFDGRRSPFDLFGPPATSEGPTNDPGPDLSELMRQEAGGPTVEPAETFDDAGGAGPSPGFDAAFDLGEAAPADPIPPAGPTSERPDLATRPVPAAPESAAGVAPNVTRDVPSEPDLPAGRDLSPERDLSPDRDAPGERQPAPEAYVDRPIEEVGAADTVGSTHGLGSRRAEPRSVNEAAAVTSAPALVDGKKLWILRMLLIGNIAMVFVMLVLPHPLEPRTEPVPEVVGETPSGDTLRPNGGAPANRFIAPARAQGLGLPDEARYERALLLAVDGDFDGACSELQGLLDDAPDLNPAVARLVHAHLAYYLRKAGRLGAALEHERFARQEADRSALPEELLREARVAQAAGDGAAVRRAYAKFLLQQGQLSPDMRALVHEALIEIGDSYRVQAEAGERAAGEPVTGERNPAERVR